MALLATAHSDGKQYEPADFNPFARKVKRSNLDELEAAFRGFGTERRP